MTTMIEKVARAIAAVEGYDVDGLKAYATSSSIARADYAKLLEKARAAIEAMREPTPPMLLAGTKHVAQRGDTYTAMITAALEETP